MSQLPAEEITVFAVESESREEGKRKVSSVRIELGASIDSKLQNGFGRSDYFRGVESTLTFAQAKHLYELLGTCINFVESLEEAGSVVVQR